MRTFYNALAAHNLDRLAALSDGIFAVAMTLLVLELHVPVIDVLHVQQPLWANGALQPEQVLWNALVKLAPSLLAYFMSFMTLGIFWVGQQTQLNYFKEGDRHLTWIHLAFLLSISLMPFSTALLANFITYRLALVIYWFNILLMGILLFVSLQYASHANLLKNEQASTMFSVNSRRIITAQGLYALGALLCIFNTYLSIGFIVLIQLNYAIAPRIGWLERI